jgi:hypothetical protein
MQIDHLSEHIENKLSRLDQQLANLREARQQVDEPAAQSVIDDDIATLLDTRARLLKSRSLAWRVHQLRQQTDPSTRDTRYRSLGLALMIFSGVALAGLIAMYFWLH